MGTDKEKLQAILLEKSFKLGDFTLSSGKKSDYYVDCRTATLDANGLYLISSLLLDYIANEKIGIDAIGGLTLAADPIVGGMVALSAKTSGPLSGFIVRKEAKGHGTGKLIEGNLKACSRVGIIEDVVTTGASAMKAINAAKECGGEIKVVLAVVDREEGGREEIGKLGIPVYSLFTATELKAAAKKAAK
jgi:orotate phosphoribosyltransferase